jgi:type 1 glutamine amidotransferase
VSTRTRLVLLAALAGAAGAAAAPLAVHIISGSTEYRSEESLRGLIPELERHGMKVTASWGRDRGTELPDLEALTRADLMIIFARRLVLPENQMKLVRAHWEAGKPVIGIRTASHAWGERGSPDNFTFDRQVLGNHYTGHHGDQKVEVRPAPGAEDHPVLHGMGPITSRKLYRHGELAPTAVVLQHGDNGIDRQAVTLVHEYRGGRMFYTSLGVPEDFTDPNFRRMLLNAFYWTTRRQPPGTPAHAMPAAAPAKSTSTAGTSSQTAAAATEPIVFEVTDSAVVQPITSGRWDLSGRILELRFTGRIAPHENSVYSFFGPGVEAVTGRFARVVLPPGWRYDIRYDEAARSVVMYNLRPDRAPAFPGAEGFGKYTLGGRGGRVIAVTNLNDSGPGSLRDAVMAEGPRTVVFRVSGTIALESELKVRNPFLTIAGQTAPGDGICLKNYQFSFDTEHLIVRYMRFRPGDETRKEQDAVGGQGNYIIFDHCSASWAIDETFSINKASNLTVQWCMVTESLTHSFHKKGRHGYGGLWGGPGGSWHHNILAHHTSRNPRASGNAASGLMDFRNNVIYNWGFNSAYGGELWPRNWVNNYYKSGPATDDKVRHRIFIQKDPRGTMYASGNHVYGFPAITANNWNGGVEFVPDGGASEATLRVHEPFVVAPITTQTAELAYELVLAGAGCSLVRDAVDRRIIEEIRTGTARFGETYKGGGKGIIDSQRAVGGWPVLRSLPAPIDSDGDGMPDEWELRHGLDPHDPSDGARDRTGDGYTNLEEYLNSLIPAPRIRS